MLFLRDARFTMTSTGKSCSAIQGGLHDDVGYENILCMHDMDTTTSVKKNVDEAKRRIKHE
jgi:hypothetical protein